MMPGKTIPNRVNSARPNWRDYQASLQHISSQRRLSTKTFKFLVAGLILLLFLGVITYRLGAKTNYAALTEYFHRVTASEKGRQHPSDPFISKKDVQALLEGQSFVNLATKSFIFNANDTRFQATTSLDIVLQNFLLKHLNVSTSRYIGIVGMDPTSGRILSMVGFDKTDPSNDPCVANRFPAASIFKIVTAAAAIEECGFNLNSKLAFNGRRHTLYKSQLKDRINKYTNQITFKESFALSVNPVFGKIGAHYLGKTTLEDYALAFGFNRDIDFEIPVAPSQISFSDDPYQWAEIACGFNRQTKISPLHGALIASAILNQGRMVEPRFIDQIKDANGRILYRSHSMTINQAVTPQASKIINKLMKTTIQSGTCKSAFRGFKKDPTLSKLNIGGKSGSINNKSHDTRYDWFVGFAEEKQGTAKIVISAVVAHEKYLGTRASQYARMAMKHYFRNYFANQQKKL